LDSIHNKLKHTLSNSTDNYENIKHENNVANALNPMSRMEQGGVTKPITYHNGNTNNGNDSKYIMSKDISSENESDDSNTGHVMSESPMLMKPSNHPMAMNQSETLSTVEQNCEIEKSCTAKTCSTTNLHPILNPTFNMREVAKQCLLLEDHLNNIKKRCYDCIRKHFLIIDALLEEAVSLENNIDKRDYYRNLYLTWVKLEKNYAQNQNDSKHLDEISKKIRIFRKPLVEQYFDTISEYSD
jgi:hypothetical protein